MGKILTAIDLCRVLKTHFSFSSDSKKTLMETPFSPTNAITIGEMLSGVIAGNGKMMIEDNREAPPEKPLHTFKDGDRVKVSLPWNKFSRSGTVRGTCYKSKSQVTVCMDGNDPKSRTYVYFKHLSLLDPKDDVIEVCGTCSRAVFPKGQRGAKGTGWCKCHKA